MSPHGVELTALEDFLRALHDDCQGMGIVTAVGRYSGVFNPERLERALSALQQRHPLLRAAVAPRDRRWTYSVCAAAPPIPLEWIATDDPAAWTQELVLRSRVLFHSRQAPLLRATVLRDKSSRWSDLLITVHHLIADGRSLATLYRELTALYLAAETTVPRVEPQPWRPPQVPTTQGNWGVIWRRIWEDAVERRKLRGYPRVNFVRPPSGGIACRRDVLSAAATADLRSRCRQEGTTIYGALAAATLQTLGSASQGRHFPLQTPLDIRGLCSPPLAPDQVGCLAWSMRHAVAAPEARPFWELARACRADLDAYLQSSRFAGAWNRFPSFLRMIGARRIEQLRRRRATPYVSLNNVGVVTGDPLKHGFGLREFGWYTNREQSAPVFEVVAATVAGQLNLTFTSPLHAAGELAGFGAECRRRLERAAQDLPVACPRPFAA